MTAFEFSFGWTTEAVERWRADGRWEQVDKALAMLRSLPKSGDKRDVFHQIQDRRPRTPQSAERQIRKEKETRRRLKIGLAAMLAPLRVGDTFDDEGNLLRAVSKKAPKKPKKSTK